MGHVALGTYLSTWSYTAGHQNSYVHQFIPFHQPNRVWLLQTPKLITGSAGILAAGVTWDNEPGDQRGRQRRDWQHGNLADQLDELPRSKRDGRGSLDRRGRTVGRQLRHRLPRAFFASRRRDWRRGQDNTLTRPPNEDLFSTESPLLHHLSGETGAATLTHNVYE